MGDALTSSPDFPGAPVAEKPPADARDTGSTPGPGKPHTPWHSYASKTRLLMLGARVPPRSRKTPHAVAQLCQRKPPANAKGTGSIPGPGKPHMPWHSYASEMHLLMLGARVPPMVQKTPYAMAQLCQRNPLANARDTGSTPGPGKPHTPWHSYASEMRLPILGTWVPPLVQESPTRRGTAMPVKCVCQY